MFIYDHKAIFKWDFVKGDEQLFFECNAQGGYRPYFQLIEKYCRQAMMCNNKKFLETFYHLSANLLSNMEIYAQLMHQLHGEDACFLDESNDDTPVFEVIASTDRNQVDEPCVHHYIDQDLTANLMQDEKDEEELLKNRQDLFAKCYDSNTLDVIKYLNKQSEKRKHVIRTMLEILNNHQEVKDFGVGNTHNEWDLDTSNYFDKPNPTFIAK